jgi:hypothetical protein
MNKAPMKMSKISASLKIMKIIEEKHEMAKEERKLKIIVWHGSQHLAAKMKWRRHRKKKKKIMEWRNDIINNNII